MSYTVLLVEDNDSVREINREAFLMAGYRVLEAATIAQSRDVLAREPVDLVVLDILLPDGSGIAFCQEMRRQSDVPILFLSALTDNRDIIRGLQAGGDDYLPKPYSLSVLLARAEAMLRRQRLREERAADLLRESAPASVIVRGCLSLDLSALTATVRGRDALLTPREFALLLALVRAEGREVSSEALYHTAWGLKAIDDKRALRIQISRLRTKLNAVAKGSFEIANLRGRGYQFFALDGEVPPHGPGIPF